MLFNFLLYPQMKFLSIQSLKRIAWHFWELSVTSSFLNRVWFNLLQHFHNTVNVIFIGLCECADSSGCIPVSWSNFFDIFSRVVTDRAARVLDSGVKFAPMLPTISLNSRLMCSLCRSHGMLRPGPPCVLTNLPQVSWWTRSGGSDASWNCNTNASSEYFVRLSAWKWSMKIFQHLSIRGPSPSYI